MLQGEVGTHGSGDIAREDTLKERAGGAQGHLETGVVQGHNSYIGHVRNIHGGIAASSAPAMKFTRFFLV